MSNQTRVISFDIFDTLVTRCVARPVDVFSCVERRICIQKMGVKNFSLRRIQAEKRALETYGAEQLTIDQIYSKLEGVPDGLRDSLKALEEQAEIDLSLPLKEGVVAFNNAVLSGIPVVLISDMYLPRNVIEKILSHCGISGYKRLYVSAESGKSKATGKLFQQVLSDFQIKPNELQHCGDSILGDYKRPKKLGINAKLVVDGRRISKFQRVLHSVRRRFSNVQGFSIERVAQLCFFENRFQQLGFETLGPFLYGFVKWVHERKEELGIESLLFLSRDGYLMKRAYDIIYPNELSEYIYASRRAWTVPLYHKNPDLEYIISHAGFGRDISIDEFLTRVGIGEENKATLLTSTQFSLNDRISVNEILSNKDFLSLFKIIQSTIIENSRQEYDSCSEYLSNVIPGNKVGLVDIGWRGSMQHALDELLNSMGQNTDITGLYIGVDRHSRWIGRQKMCGYMFDNNRGHDVQDKESLYNSLMEALFIAPHGSLNHYEVINDEVVPIFQTAERGIEDGSCPLFSVQEGALMFINKVVANKWEEYVDISKIGSLDSIERLGLNPTYEEAEHIGDIQFAYQDYKSLAKPHKVYYYIRNPRILRDDFLTCYWKPAFIKRLFKYLPNLTPVLLFLKKYFAE